MKLYRITWHDADKGACVDWASSQAEARHILAEAKRGSGEKFESGTVDPIEFAPTKAGILDLLKTHTPHHDRG